MNKILKHSPIAHIVRVQRHVNTYYSMLHKHLVNHGYQPETVASDSIRLRYAMSDLNIIDALSGLAILRPAQGVPRIRPECHPDRDNFALIMGIARFARDALSDASAAEVAQRKEEVLDCIAAAKRCGMFYDIGEPMLEEMMRAIEAVRRERSFLSASDAFAQDPADLPSHPTPEQVAAGVKAGARSASTAVRIWQAMVGHIGVVAK